MTKTARPKKLPAYQSESLFALGFKFAGFCLIAGLILLVELSFWNTILARYRGGPDWFLQHNPNQAPPPMMALFLLAAVITGLVALVRWSRLWQLEQVPQKGIRQLLRGVTVLSVVIICVVTAISGGARSAAWEGYVIALQAAEAKLALGQSPALAEARFDQLGMSAYRNQSGGVSKSLRKLIYNTGTDEPDMYDIELCYQPAGKLAGWRFTRTNYAPTDEPSGSGTQLLREMPPVKAGQAHPCSK